MRPFTLTVFMLGLAALACSLPGSVDEPTSDPNVLATHVSATLTALAPAEATLTVTVPAPATETAAPPTATPELAGSVCPLAYSDGANLYCLAADGTAQTLAALTTGTQIWQPRISADGHWVAYQVTVGEGLSELWVVGSDPAANPPRRLIGAEQIPHAEPGYINSPQTYEWAAGTTLIFDTRWQSSAVMGPGERLNADLWSVDAVTGALQPLLPPGSAGEFAVSPNGQFVAIARPQGLDLVNSDGSNYRQDLITFPPVITYSEYLYRPRPVWSPDSSFFSVVIPSADPMAADTSGAFYRVGADGIVEPLGSVPGNFLFGGALRPHFAPAGQHVIYSQGRPEGGPEAVHLVTLQPEGTTDQVVDEAVSPNGLGWAPDSQHFVYTSLPGDAPGQGFVLGLAEGDSQPFADGLLAVLELQWIDASSFAFVGRFGDGDWALYRYTLGQLAPELLASGLNMGSSLDTR